MRATVRLAAWVDLTVGSTSSTSYFGGASPEGFGEVVVNMTSVNEHLGASGFIAVWNGSFGCSAAASVEVGDVVEDPAMLLAVHSTELAASLASFAGTAAPQFQTSATQWRLDSIAATTCRENVDAVQLSQETCQHPLDSVACLEMKGSGASTRQGQVSDPVLWALLACPSNSLNNGDVVAFNDDAGTGACPGSGLQAAVQANTVGSATGGTFSMWFLTESVSSFDVGSIPIEMKLSFSA